MPTLGRTQAPLLLRAEGLEGDAGRRWGRATLVVARGLCRLKWFALAHVPAHERADALRVQALAWQPFDDSALCLVLGDDEGLAVAWDARQVREALAERGVRPDACKVLPEVLLRAPGADGPRLVRMSDGVEGQVWRNGRLVASRWWPEAPAPEAWRLFAQSLSGEAASWTLPTVDDAPAWLNKPWAVPLADQAHDQARESRLVDVALAALVFCAGVVGAQWWGVERSLRDQLASNADQRARLGPVLAERDAALQRSAEAGQWAQWLIPTVLPVELFEALHEALAKRQVVVKELDWRGDKLRMGLQVPAALPRSELLKGVQSVRQFANPTEVRVESGRDLLWLDVDLRTAMPGGAPAGAQAATAFSNAGAAPRADTAAAPSGPAAAITTAPTPAALPPTPPAPVVAARPAPAPGSTKPNAPATAPAEARPQFRSNPKPIAMAASGEDFPPQSVFDAVK